MWKDGQAELNTMRYRASLGLLLDNMMERAVRERHKYIGEADVLYALLTFDADDLAFTELSAEDRQELTSSRALILNFLADGVKLSDCRAGCEACVETISFQPDPFDREFYREPVGTWLEELPDGAGVTDLLGKLFASPDDLPDGDIFTGLFRCEELLRAILLSGVKKDLYNKSGELQTELFKDRAQYLIDQALTIAARCGEKQVSGGHLLAAMLLNRETYTWLLLRRGGADTDSGKLMTYLQNLFPQDQRQAKPLPPVRDSFDDELSSSMEEAIALSASVGDSRAGERELLSRLLCSEQVKVQYLFETVLKISPADYLVYLEDLKEPDIIEPLLPLEICECRNLTASGDPLTIRSDVVEPIVKVFFRKSARNVLLHGERGIGLSTAGDMLARELRSGKYPSLRQVQVIRFDLSSVEDDRYDSAVVRLMRFFEDEPDRIYVVEGLGKYMHEHFAETVRRLKHSTTRLLIIVSEQDYNLIDQDGEQLRSCLTPQVMSEPEKSETMEMINLSLPKLSSEYGVRFAKGAVQAAYRMSNDYLISQRFPKKAIDLLEMTASDVAAEAEMRGKSEPEVTREALARVMSDRTGLPAETILGTGTDKDYVYLLSQNLVGQEAAVEKVAGRLDLIQKGMVDKHAPAAVFVFAGLSGTGKTEMAKQIAQIYANSRKLISFSMENFGESHSVSRLIGTPPGYVGYEEGGKLINDLNKDPYSVVLLDEVEKAHPAVWDPFLNLFDEGVITDMRGVTASGSKAFFVLTSNIGQYEIADMLRRGCPPSDIENIVKEKFNTEVHKKSGEKCFRPEFIGRIMRRGGIVVFNALSLDALKGIARHNLSKIAKSYGETHESKLECDDEVLDMIAGIVYEKNEEAIRRGNGYFGGRELDNLMNQYIQEKLASQIRQLAGVPLVRVVLDGNDTAIVPVYNEADAEELLESKRMALVDKVARRFDSLTLKDPDCFADLKDDQLIRLNALLSQIDMIL